MTLAAKPQPSKEEWFSLHPTAKRLLEQGRPFALVALFDGGDRPSTAWPVGRPEEYVSPGCVMLVIDDNLPQRAKDMLTAKMANAYYLAPNSSRKRGERLFSSRADDMPLWIDATSSPAKVGVPISRCFLAYSDDEPEGAPPRARRASRKRGDGGGRATKEFHPVKPTSRMAAIEGHRFAQFMNRRKRRRESGSTGWERSLRACRKALANRFEHVERIEPPTAAHLERWSVCSGLHEAAQCLRAQIEAWTLSGAVAGSSGERAATAADSKKDTQSAKKTAARSRL